MIRSIGVKSLSKKTIQKINLMVKAVVDEPDLYDQDTFGQKIACDNTAKGSTCKTACCGAGHAIRVTSPTLFTKMMKQQLKANAAYERGYDHQEKYPEWVREALKALELEVDDNYNPGILFGAADEWPYPFNDQYEKATTDKGRAKAFKNRWLHFIATDGID